MKAAVSKRGHGDLVQVKGQLWTAGIKIRGIGYLIKYQTPDALADAEETAGIGEILRGIGEEIAEICDCLDGEVKQ